MVKSARPSAFFDGVDSTIGGLFKIVAYGRWHYVARIFCKNLASANCRACHSARDVVITVHVDRELATK